MPIPIIWAVAGALVIGAAPLPYGFYTLLRIVATGAFVWAAYVSYSRKTMWLLYTFGLLAIIFNPIIPVHLTKEIWAVIDVGAAIFLVAMKKYIQESQPDASG